jgi:hypothetical protein
MRCRGYVDLVGVLRMTLAGKSRHKGETQQQTHTPEAKHEEHPDLETQLMTPGGFDRLPHLSRKNYWHCDQTLLVS